MKPDEEEKPCESYKEEILLGNCAVRFLAFKNHSSREELFRPIHSNGFRIGVFVHVQF